MIYGLQATSANVERCGFGDRSRVVRADAMESITSPWLHSINEKYNLLLATPPYEEIVYMDLMERIANTTLLEKNAVVVVEYPLELSYLPQIIEEKLLGFRNRRYGRTVVALYFYEPCEELANYAKEYSNEFVPTTYTRKRLKIEGYLRKRDDGIMVV